MAFLYRARDVTYQDAQAVARVGQEKAGTGVLDAAVVVEPGFEVRRVETQVALRLLQQGEGVGACIVGLGEALQVGVFAKGVGRWLPGGRLTQIRDRVVDLETPR